MGRRKLSTSDLVEDLQRIYQELGRVPRTNDIREHGEYSYQAYYRRWGSIKDVLNAADIPHHNRIHSGVGVDKEDLITDLERLGAELNRRPT